MLTGVSGAEGGLGCRGEFGMLRGAWGARGGLGTRGREMLQETGHRLGGGLQ